MDSLNLAQTLAVWALPVLLAVTLHEVAHGWVARSLGDPTAATLGRLSLNPLKHVDPLGTVLLPALMLAFGGFIFGWAKPVPVDWRNFKNPRRDMAIVAAAGPLANFAMALGWGLLYRFADIWHAEEGLWYGVQLMCAAGISFNISIMVLNLLPLPPLDGGRVLVGLLPKSAAYQVARVEPYGMLILMLMMATSVLGAVLYFPRTDVQALVFQILGIH
jgi:Zn-dependent protease